MYRTEDFDFCRPYILSDERILWQGRPEKGNIITRKDAVLIPFGAFWLAFSLFWEIMAIKSSGSFIFALFGIPFVAVGAYLLFGRLLHAAYLRDKTFYIITNKKIIIKSGSRIKMHDARDLPPMDIEIHKNGNGTILFTEEVYTRKGRRHSTYFALENLADVVQAQNAVSMMDK